MVSSATPGPPEEYKPHEMRGTAATPWMSVRSSAGVCAWFAWGWDRMPKAMAVGNSGQMQDGTALSQGKQEINGHVPEQQEE